MSTGAIYNLFYHNESLVAFYIHSDGYPKGARTYFRKAWDDFVWKKYLEDKRLEKYEAYDLAYRFCKAIEDAKLAITPEILSSDLDIDYMYNINLPGGMLNILEHLKKCSKIIWSGSLIDFMQSEEKGND